MSPQAKLDSRPPGGPARRAGRTTTRPATTPLPFSGPTDEIARAMVVRDSVARTERHVVELAVELISGCDAADVMVLDRTHQLRTVAYTSASVYVGGLLQRHNGAGPSVTALSLGSCVVDDFSVDRRWPRLSGWASSHGLASTCVCPLATNSRTLGVLNLYSTHAGVFTPALLARAMIFAAHAALAIDSVWVES